MKTVDLSDETYAALARLAAAKGVTLDQLLAALIRNDRALQDADGLLLVLESAEFEGLKDPIERYLSLLAWCATNHASDFGDFIAHQESGHRYLALSRDEIQEVRQRNRARQIDGTQYWAVVTIDSATRRRFIRRLLEFVGCHDETVSKAERALGLSADPRLLGVA